MGWISDRIYEIYEEKQISLELEKEILERLKKEIDEWARYYGLDVLHFKAQVEELKKKLLGGEDGK